MNFSVLISLYNKESPNYYRQCLDSIVKQTLLPTEVIIIYDGFVNNELESVTNEYLNVLNIFVFKLEHNVGLGNALNYGLTKCKYDIILRMDTDDICYPNRFQVQTKFLDENKDVDVLGSAIVEFDDNSFSERRKILPIEYDDIKKFAAVKNPINHMSVAFRKNKILSCGGYIHHHFMEDYNLWLRCISSGLIIRNLPDILVRARVGDGMIKKRRGLKYVNSEIELFFLKNKTLKEGKLRNLSIFILRIIPRMVPIFILKFLYKLDRWSKH